jgi:hypothetical protein
MVIERRPLDRSGITFEDLEQQHIPLRLLLKCFSPTTEDLAYCGIGAAAGCDPAGLPKTVNSMIPRDEV